MCGIYDSFGMKVYGTIPDELWEFGKRLRAKTKVVTEHQLISDPVIDHMQELHDYNLMETNGIHKIMEIKESEPFLLPRGLV